MSTLAADPDTAGATAPAVSARGITKKFPGVFACRSVFFDAAVGEVHTLLGENGAGKSTLANIVAGLYRPDEGEVLIDGKRVDFHSPRDALKEGIFMVHQHFHLVPVFTVAENVLLGGEGRRLRLNARAIEREVAELGERYRLPVDPRARIWQLSVGEQQRVEILKALHRDARILILDEPTAVLTPQEAGELFVTLRQMAAEGRTVIFISHKLGEVMSVSDRVTVLRAGRMVGTVTTAESDTRSLAELMVGREVATGRGPDERRELGDVVLEVEGLCADGDRGRQALRNVAFSLRAGEILGVAGVAGNGQKELAETITGMRRRTAGSVTVGGRSLRGHEPREAIERRVAHVPQDRLGTGLAPSLSIAGNFILKSYRTNVASRGPMLRHGRIKELAAELIARYDVKTPSPYIPARRLSGGNLQKVVLAREFSGDPRVLVAASPTRGLDVGAIESVYGFLREAAAGGVGVLLISEDLDEIFALSDRIAVLYEGEIAGIVHADRADVSELGLMMAGAKHG